MLRVLYPAYPGTPGVYLRLMRRFASVLMESLGVLRLGLPTWMRFVSVIGREEGKHILNVLCSPNLNRLIRACTDESLSIRTDCYTANNACMTSEGPHFFS